MKLTKSSPIFVRGLTLVLVVVQVLGNNGPSLLEATANAAAAQVSEALKTSEPQPTRKRGTPPPSLPVTVRFSQNPTDAELFAAPVLPHALVPVGQSTPEENQALAQALLAYSIRTNLEDQSILLKFLSDFPKSVWKPALLLDLGSAWRRTGFFSKALAAWENAWKLSKHAGDFRAKALADQILGELVQINAWVGRYDQLESLFAEIRDRPLIGGATEMVQGAREGLSIMNTRPEKGFLCGPYAIRQIQMATQTSPDFTAVMAAKSTRQGTSLTQLMTLAEAAGLNYQMAKRKPGAEIPINSVVHWKLNHYGAVLTEDQGRYRIQDSTLNPMYAQELWVSKQAIDEESDGYFLIPSGPLPTGWETVTETEGAAVWGKGDSVRPDPPAFTKKDPKTCPDGTTRGMASASAHLMLVSLSISDTPIGYDPPLGPSMDFSLTYNQRDTYWEQASYSNFGSKWTFNWFSYISDSGSPPANDSSLTRYVSGGGALHHDHYNSITHLFQPDLDGNILQYIPAAGGDSDRYELIFPDGSKQVFGRSTVVSGPRKMLLTAVIDPVGKGVTLVYDDPVQANSMHITKIYDALNHYVTLHYDSVAFPHQITSIDDNLGGIPGRTAKFEYDQVGRLHRITDVIGMSSVFTYDSADFITAMETPYGVSKFSYTGGPIDVPNTERTLLMTDPNGDREFIWYKDFIDPMVLTDFPTVENEAPSAGGFNFALNYRNTFYFDKKAMYDNWPSGLPTFATADLLKATIYHWMHGDPITGGVLTSRILESVKSPLESRIYYGYFNGTSSSYPTSSQGIVNRNPTRIIRLIDDPESSNGLGHFDQLYQYEYNSQGKVVKITDPRSRQTTFDYYSNGIDLQKIRQTTGGTLNETLAEFGTYDSRHRPATYIDAARQTTHFVWNSDGQILYITNALNEVTGFTYDANGYLLSAKKYCQGGWRGTSFTYDSFGRIRTKTSLDGFPSEAFTITYDYDALDRVTTVWYPDYYSDRYEYSRLDLVRVWDRANHRTQATYDGVGRPLTIKDRLGRLTQFSWCGCGGLASIIDPLNQVTSWERDAEGRVTHKHFANSTQNSKNIDYVYESRTSRLKTVTDSKSQVKRYKYDLDNALTNVTYSGGSISTPEVKLTYNANYRRLDTMVDGTGTTTFSYNPITTGGTLGAGSVSSIDGPLGNDTITYTYDVLGRISQRAINNVSEGVAYDELGRITSHDLPGGGTILLSYFDNQTAAPTYTLQMTRPLGGQKYTWYSYYNNANDGTEPRLKAIANTVNTFADTNSYFGYEYDVLRRINHWTIDPIGTAMTLRYDDEGQLTGATVANPGQSPTKSYAYAYDGAGNRTNQQIETTSPAHTKVTKLAYNNVNQLNASSGSGNLPVYFQGTVNETATVTVNSQSAKVASDNSFDKWLNLTAGSQNAQIVAVGGSGANTTTKNYTLNVEAGDAKTYGFDDNGNCTANASVTYEWDSEDRLVAINNGTLRSEFTYDGFGRRVKIVEKNGTAITSTKQFVWCGSQICEERDGANNVTKRFYAEGEQIGSTKYLFNRDHLGNVREMVDWGGLVAASYDYDPYGKRTKTGGSLDADFGFTGHYFHAPSGLHLAMYRAYDSETGRWLNRDLIGEGGGLNLYGYAKNSPINYRDALGLLAGGPLVAGLLETTSAQSGGGILATVGEALLESGGPAAAALEANPLGAVVVTGTIATALVAEDVMIAADIHSLNSATAKGEARLKQMEEALKKKKEERKKKPFICYHYSQDPPGFFPNGLEPPAWVTTLAGLDSQSAMNGFGIAPPLYQYTFAIDPNLLGPIDDSTPGGWPYVQYEVLGPTGADSLIGVQAVPQTHGSP